MIRITIWLLVSIMLFSVSIKKIYCSDKKITQEVDECIDLMGSINKHKIKCPPEYNKKITTSQTKGACENFWKKACEYKKSLPHYLTLEKQYKKTVRKYDDYLIKDPLAKKIQSNFKKRIQKNGDPYFDMSPSITLKNYTEFIKKLKGKKYQTIYEKIQKDTYSKEYAKQKKQVRFFSMRRARKSIKGNIRALKRILKKVKKQTKLNNTKKLKRLEDELKKRFGLKLNIEDLNNRIKHFKNNPEDAAAEYMKHRNEECEDKIKYCIEYKNKRKALKKSLKPLFNHVKQYFINKSVVRLDKSEGKYYTGDKLGGVLLKYACILVIEEDIKKKTQELLNRKIVPAEKERRRNLRATGCHDDADPMKRFKLMEKYSSRYEVKSTSKLKTMKGTVGNLLDDVFNKTPEDFENFVEDLLTAFHSTEKEHIEKKLIGSNDFRKRVENSIYTPSVKKRFQGIFEEMKDKILKSANFANLPEGVKKKINKIPLIYPTNYLKEVESKRDRDDFVKFLTSVDAHFSKSGQHIMLYGGFTDQHPMLLAGIFAHEIGHAIDFKVDFYSNNREIAKLKKCLSDKRSINAKKSQFNESLADWFKTEAMADWLEKDKTLSLEEKQKLIFASVYKCDDVRNYERIVRIQHFSTLEVKGKRAIYNRYPRWDHRENKILMAHPTFRKIFNCEKKATDPLYCESPWRKK